MSLASKYGKVPLWACSEPGELSWSKPVFPEKSLSMEGAKRVLVEAFVWSPKGVEVPGLETDIFTLDFKCERR